MRSSTFKLWSNPKGDFYVASRDIGAAFKASLHRDGNCHIGYTDPYAEKYGKNPRHFMKWKLDLNALAPGLLILVAPRGSANAFSAGKGRQMDCARAKSEFLAITSHELRTPLNAIAGYSQLLEEGVYGALNQKQTEGVASIHRNEQRLLSLIDEVLGVVSAEKGQVALHRELVKVVDAFEAVRPLIAPQLEEHHCVLERSTVEAQLVVRADRQSLQQILMRLLSNASKFSKDGGTVTLGADREGDRVRIWVRDKGVGISQADIEKVFEPFFQTEQATTRRFSGIGLGLTIARNLALRMEGEVTLKSEPGQGTTASVLLPAA